MALPNPLKNSLVLYLLLALCVAPVSKARADYDVPGDSHMVELLYEVRHLTDANDPNFFMIWGTLLSFLAVHSLFHSIGELRAERFELERKAEELHLDRHERAELAKEIAHLSKSMIALEDQLTRSTAKLKNLAADLKTHANPATNAKLAKAIDKVVDSMKPQRSGSKARDFFAVVDRFLRSEQGGAFTASKAGVQWKQAYTKEREAYRDAQMKFFQAFDRSQKTYEEFAEKQMGTAAMPKAGEFGAHIHVTNDQGVRMSRLEPTGALNVVAMQNAMCEEGLQRLAHKEAQVRKEANPFEFYTSAPNRAFLRGPSILAGATVASTIGLYAYKRSQHGSDPLQHEIERQANYGVHMNTKMDLLSQLVSKEAEAELAPFFESMEGALHHHQKDLTDAISASLQRLDMDKETTLKLASALENKVNVRSAIQLAIVKAGRTNGLYGLNRQQLILLFNPNFKAVPEQWRTSFLGDIVHDTINQIWSVPGTDVAASVPAQLKIELRDALLEELKAEANHGHLRVTHPEMCMDMPGTGPVSEEALKGFTAPAHGAHHGPELAGDKGHHHPQPTKAGMSE